MDELPRDATSSVGRVVAVIRMLCAEPNGVSLRKAAEQLAISKSAVQRILARLAEEDVAAARADGSYAAGPALLVWASQLLRSSSLLDVADRVMRSLVATVGETVCFARLLPAEGRLVFVHIVEVDRPVKYVVPVGSTAPLHAGAVGKAVLAAMPEGTLDSLTLDRYTPTTPQDRGALARELDTIREQGYAVSFGERYDGAAGIAAPLVVRGSLIGGLSITIPQSRLDVERIPWFADQARTAVREMAELIPAQAVAVSVVQR